MNSQETTAGEAPPSPRSPVKTAAKVAGAILLVAALYWLGRQAGGYVADFRDWVDGLGAWAPAVFIAGYAVATVAFVPGFPLTLAAGAIFGLLQGTAYVLVGATLGASAAFLIARYAARDWVRRKLANYPKFAQLDQAIGRDGGLIVALTRLSPVFPFNLLNYGLGLTAVRFPHYLVACLAMLPGTFMYVYAGKVGADVAAGAESSTADWALKALGLVATIAVTVIITRKAKRVLEGKVEEES